MRLRTDSSAAAIADTRHRIAALTRGRLSAPRAEDLELATAEALSNAVMHGEAGGPIDVDVSVNSTVRVEVANRAQGFDPAHRGERSEGGFGLRIIGRAADRWGFQSNGVVRVWFCFDI